MTMTDLLLENISLDGRVTNIAIKQGKFVDLNANSELPAQEKFDASGLAIVPSFHNTHTHAAMTLLRGFADDMPLFTWLNEHIWPMEAKLTSQDIYDGSRLAILEMIMSGTTFFADMYWDVEQTIRAVDEMGIRAAIGVTFMDRMGEEQIAQNIKFLENWQDPSNGRIHLTLAPHAIYTVSAPLLKRCARTAQELGLMLTIHLSETEQEVEDCIKAHGLTPVRWLDHLGVLGSNVVVAHCIHVDHEEMQILAQHGTTIAHNPCSNMKLGSGIFASADLQSVQCHLTIGTDGASSNNNLDMREEMKFASLLAKTRYESSTLKANEVFAWATVNGAKAFGLNAGRIAQGALADAVLLDLSNERLVPNYNLISNWVYAADSSAVDSVLCDGKFVMRHGYVDNEEEILACAKACAERLVSK